jgi:hypothetical protein
VDLWDRPVDAPATEEPAPVGALPEPVGEAAALAAALLMHPSTHDYIPISKMVEVMT